MLGVSALVFLLPLLITLNLYFINHNVVPFPFLSTWTGQQEQPVQLMYRVKLLGAKEPNNFFLIRLPAPQGEHVTVTLQIF